MNSEVAYWLFRALLPTRPCLFASEWLACCDNYANSRMDLETWSRTGVLVSQLFVRETLLFSVGCGCGVECQSIYMG